MAQQLLTPEFFIGLAAGLPLGALLLFVVFLLAAGWADEQEEVERARRDAARPASPHEDTRAADIDGFAQKREVSP